MEALPRSCADRLLSASAYTDLPDATELYRREEEPEDLYLLTSGIASLVLTSVAGTGIELATLCTEGLVGWIYLFGPLLEPSTCAMQVAGGGYRVPIAAVQRELDNTPEFRFRVLEYSQHQSIAANQIAACNRLHRAAARFSRWLLMMADRLGTEDITITQEFLSNLLGTRRTIVAEAGGYWGAQEPSRAGAAGCASSIGLFWSSGYVSATPFCARATMPFTAARFVRCRRASKASSAGVSAK